ncbi:MAG: PD40 domain-containing protein, partial [Blastocatellia bacterium]|nr:PD40 domain-containing protein [Blastocatellia bacterium]
MRQVGHFRNLFLLSIPLALTFLSGAPGWAQGTRSDSDRLPLEPARSVEFTTDEGTWMSLDVSPDGQSLVFDLLGHLYLLPIGGGEAKAITTGMEFDRAPRFSPDGRRIVFVSDRGGADDIWVANSDGSNPQQLTREEHTLFVSPRWTIDG